MGLVDILKSRGMSPRDDIANALNSTHDMMYPGQQSNLYTPQLIHAAKWAEANINNNEKTTIQLMGWASLGKRALGGPRLGMFILTTESLCFVRREESLDGSLFIEIIHDTSKISNVISSGWLGLRTLSYTVDGKEYKLERLQKDNLKLIISQIK